MNLKRDAIVGSVVSNSPLGPFDTPVGIHFVFRSDPATLYRCAIGRIAIVRSAHTARLIQETDARGAINARQ